MAPVVHGLERDYARKIGFVYLDIDDPAVTLLEQELGYRLQPHLLLLDYEGNVVKQWVGLPSEKNLTTAFDALLAGKPIP
jgi:hypothetical protein